MARGFSLPHASLGGTAVNVFKVSYVKSYLYSLENVHTICCLYASWPAAVFVATFVICRCCLMLEHQLSLGQISRRTVAGGSSFLKYTSTTRTYDFVLGYLSPLEVEKPHDGLACLTD